MQYNQNDMQITAAPILSFSPIKKKSKARKWREIEALKARQQLSKELHDIDQSFDFSLSDLL